VRWTRYRKDQRFLKKSLAAHIRRQAIAFPDVLPFIGGAVTR
jgi:hypothetical protein